MLRATLPLVFFSLTFSVFGQQLGLRDYLQRLKTAPGTTIEQRIDNLSALGVTLSDSGFKELDRLTAPSGTHAAGRPRGYGSNSVQNDFNPMDSYTVRPRPFGGSTIQNDFDPTDSYTVRPRPFGGSTIQNDFNPMDSYTVKPRPFGGSTIQNDFDPMDSYTVRPRPFGGSTIQKP